MAQVFNTPRSVRRTQTNGIKILKEESWSTGTRLEQGNVTNLGTRFSGCSALIYRILWRLVTIECPLCLGVYCGENPRWLLSLNVPVMCRSNQWNVEWTVSDAVIVDRRRSLVSWVHRRVEFISEIGRCQSMQTFLISHHQYFDTLSWVAGRASGL